MEYKIIDDNTGEGNQLAMSGEAVQYLVKSRNWALIIAIIGFVFCGLMLLAGIVFMLLSFTPNNSLTNKLPIPTEVLGILYLVLVAIYFFPMLYLQKFANATSRAAKTLDPNQLTSAIKNLNRHFRWIGILLLSSIGIYLVVIIGLLVVKVL